jgi:hypothetical protein
MGQPQPIVSTNQLDKQKFLKLDKLKFKWLARNLNHAAYKAAELFQVTHLLKTAQT